MKRILVTGASGQLARCIKDISEEYKDFDFDFATSADLDITSKEQVDLIFQNKKYDFCINCAAYTAVDKAEEEQEKAKKVNIDGAQNLAEACKNYNSVLVHISTDFVFDGTKNAPYSEDDSTNPVSVYGTTKLEGEKAIEQVLKSYFIIRTSWLYSEYGNNFMKTMLRLGQEREELSVVDDQEGTPTYAKDLASFIHSIISENSNKYGLYHYSNQGKTTWYGFAKAIFNFEKIKVNLSPIPTSQYPTPAKRPHYSVLSKQKVHENFKIQIPQWEESLKLALKALK